MVELVRHRQTKEPETDRPDLNHRATSRLYLIVRDFCAAAALVVQTILTRMRKRGVRVEARPRLRVRVVNAAGLVSKGGFDAATPGAEGAQKGVVVGRDRLRKTRCF